MPTTKTAIHDVLRHSQDWLTIIEITKRVSAGASTVARALRKLREEGHVRFDRVPSDPRWRKRWAATGIGKISTKRSGTRNVISITTVSITPVSPTKVWDCPVCNISNPMQHTVCQACGAVPHKKDQLMSLEQATETIISDFMTQQKTFSAHDVTSELRDRSNTGVVSVDPAKIGTVNVNGSDVPRVSHTEVRDLVHTLFTQGKMPGYDRTINGTYFEYVPATTTDADDTDSDDKPDGSNYDGSSSL